VTLNLPLYWTRLTGRPRRHFLVTWRWWTTLAFWQGLILLRGPCRGTGNHCRKSFEVSSDSQHSETRAALPCQGGPRKCWFGICFSSLMRLPRFA
jgi:hypothetical protein